MVHPVKIFAVLAVTAAGLLIFSRQSVGGAVTGGDTTQIPHAAVSRAINNMTVEEFGRASAGLNIAGVPAIGNQTVLTGVTVGPNTRAVLNAVAGGDQDSAAFYLRQIQQGNF